MLKGKKGFTLIELVVVIAILGILAGIAIPRFLDATATARGARIVADLRTIDSAIVIYNAKTGNLPTQAQITTAAEAGTANPDTYQLIAAWPVPPTGAAIVTTSAGGENSFTVPAGATYTLADGRAVFGSLNVEGLLAGTAPNFSN